MVRSPWTRHWFSIVSAACAAFAMDMGSVIMGIVDHRSLLIRLRCSRTFQFFASLADLLSARVEASRDVAARTESPTGTGALGSDYGNHCRLIVSAGFSEGLRAPVAPVPTI